MSDLQTVKEFIGNAIYSTLIEHIGFVDPIAHQLAKKILTELQRLWGGRMIYISAPGHKERDLCVKQEFNGRNHRHVCNQFGISLSTLYRTLKR